MNDSERMAAIAACGAFDEALTDGRMTAPRSEMPKSIRIRDLLEWCSSVGRSTGSLADAEIQRFVIK